MGSRSEIDLAYIAGFLDGDGSLMLQLKKRSDSKRSIRFMSTICFYQDTRHKDTLDWIKDTLGIGYLSDRKDGMTELRINGFKQVNSIIQFLVPYIKFKRSQSIALLEATKLLSEKHLKNLSEEELRRIITLIVLIQRHNYSTRSKRSEEELLSILGLTP